MYRNKIISLLVPCFNEEHTIKKVINDFRRYMPAIDIYVFDNLSTDSTKDIALKANAEVRAVNSKGKGNVVRKAFADIESDIYILVDGDATYDASSVTTLVDELIDHHLDMVIGKRVIDSFVPSKSYRFGHQFGNKFFNLLVSFIFKNQFTDIFSGYRVFSKRFVKSFPCLSDGFEIEAELSIHALQIKALCLEIPVQYRERPEGSFSKLSTYSDGVKILFMVMKVFIYDKPLKFFGAIGLFCFLISTIILIPIFNQYFLTHLVPRFPSLFVAIGFILSGILSLFSGLILDVVTRGRIETKRMFYLNYPAV